jgi:hypothetical protein
MELTQSIIEQAPEGATHADKTIYYRMADWQLMRWVLGKGDGWKTSIYQRIDESFMKPLNRKPAAPLQTEREPDLICASDRAGIAAFVPPPEPQKVERPARVSTVNRAWRWL